MGAEVVVEGLTKSFGSQNIWRDVSLTLPPGEVSALLGPSGTGKSVFLKSMIGLLKPERGRFSPFSGARSRIGGPVKHDAATEPHGWRLLPRRARRSGAAALVMVPLLLGMPASAAGSGGGLGACPVVAAAQGVQIMVSASDNLALQAPTGAALPMAQTCVDYGVSDSSGFAGNPYPGDTVIAAPAIIRGATELPAPDYPAYAASRHPSAEESTVEHEGYTLSSASTETSSEARADTGFRQDGGKAGAALATASAAVNPDARSATAAATSDARPLAVNDVLELGRIRSTATAKIGADGKVVRTSTLSIGRTVVAGQVVEITPDGVKAAGQTAPVPSADPAEQLEAAGIKVRYLAEEKTTRGVLSAGVEASVRHTDAETGGTYTVQYTLGRAFAAVAPVEARGGDASGSDLPLVPQTPSAGNGTATDAAPAQSTEAAADAAESGPVPADPPPAGAPASAPAPAVAQPGLLVGHPMDMGMTGLYLVVVFGALAMVAGGMLLRLLGVRTRWTA